MQSHKDSIEDIQLVVNDNSVTYAAIQSPNQYNVTITVRAFDGELYSAPVSVTSTVAAYTNPNAPTVTSTLTVRLTKVSGVGLEGVKLTSAMRKDTWAFVPQGVVPELKEWVNGYATFTLPNVPAGVLCEVIARDTVTNERSMVEGVTI